MLDIYDADGHQSQLNEAAAEDAQEREVAVQQAMGKLGLDPDDDGAYGVLDDLYADAYAAGQQWEYSYPS